MTHESIDVFCHWLPEKFCERVRKTVDRIPLMWDRAAAIPVMSSLQERLRTMDRFPGYRQIPSLASPAVEALAGPDRSPELARAANEAMRETVDLHPDRFLGFVACLPLNNPEAALREAEYALRDLGALGVQIYTSVLGKPVDRTELLQLFEFAAVSDRAVWLHPIRGMDRPDYPDEVLSKYDLWWALGWPHETSVAMARLAFAGIFDRRPNLKVVTHHGGGTIPTMEGRLGSGLELLGTRNPPRLEYAVQSDLREKPVEAIRRFLADTATFGSKAAIRASLDFFGRERILFATDSPFDPEGGPGYIRETLEAIDELEIEDGVKRAILSENARRLLLGADGRKGR